MSNFIDFTSKTNNLTDYIGTANKLVNRKGYADQFWDSIVFWDSTQFWDGLVGATNIFTDINSI